MRTAAIDSFKLNKGDLDILIKAVSTAGYRIIGPKIESGAIIYRELAGISELPKGWIDIQDGGEYRLKKEGDSYFGYVVGPVSPKRFLFPPELKLWTVSKNNGTMEIKSAGDDYPKTALLGVRPCELAAISIQDRIYTEGQYADSLYKARREKTLLIVVNCTRAGGTCFCVSMGTGPSADSGFDIALTEVGGDDGYFIIESGSEGGREILDSLSLGPATGRELDAAKKAIENAARNMGRKLDNSGIREILQSNFNSPRFDEVALRCLACGNCTLVCPTCFCSTVIDTTDLSGERSERIRRWDSCFNLEHSYIHGGHIRTSILSRYRQWITHKLSSWIDQFGISGCVGCGRCITWCPVGIDITEEAAAIGSTAKEKIKAGKG